MYYLCFEQNGNLAGYGNLQMTNCVNFEVDYEVYKLADTAKAIMDNDKVIGFTVDNSCVVDEETELVVNKGETVADKVDKLIEMELQNAEYLVELDYRISVMELNGGTK